MNGNGAAARRRLHGERIKPIATAAASVRFGNVPSPCRRPASLGPAYRMEDRPRSFATRAVVGRSGPAVASTIRVAHLAMAAAVTLRSAPAATAGGGEMGYPIGYSP